MNRNNKAKFIWGGIGIILIAIIFKRFLSIIGVDTFLFFDNLLKISDSISPVVTWASWGVLTGLLYGTIIAWKKYTLDRRLNFIPLLGLLLFLSSFYFVNRPMKGGVSSGFSFTTDQSNTPAATIPAKTYNGGTQPINNNSTTTNSTSVISGQTANDSNTISPAKNVDATNAKQFEWITCTTCNGTGSVLTNENCSECQGLGKIKCSSCTGSGKFTCTTCNGKGVSACYSCNGKGYNPCYSCGGKGNITCYSCGGKGQITCYSCGGKGQITCYSCGGKGQIVSYNGAVTTCRACGGAGHKTCSACSGAGYKTCSACSGAGSKTCTACSGNGQKKCSACNGSGTKNCPSCSGAGYKSCSYCNGSGYLACNKCGGKGTISVSKSCQVCNGKGQIQKEVL